MKTYQFDVCWYLHLPHTQSLSIHSGLFQFSIFTCQGLRAHTVRFFFKSLWIVLVRLYEHDDHVTLWGLSCYWCQTVRQTRRVNNGWVQENLSGVLHYLPYMPSDCELHCTARGTEMLAIMKSIWTVAIPAYLRRIVYAALHNHMKIAAQPVFIEKATYRMNSMSGGQERRSLCLIE